MNCQRTDYQLPTELYVLCKSVCTEIIIIYDIQKIFVFRQRHEIFKGNTHSLNRECLLGLLVGWLVGVPAVIIFRQKKKSQRQGIANRTHLNVESIFNMSLRSLKFLFPFK